MVSASARPGQNVSSIPPASSERAVALDFESVYAGCFDFIWRSVRGLGIPAASIDDVVQDVFVIAHRRLDTLASPAALKSWLFGIARRVCKDHRRATTRRGVQVALDQEREVAEGRDQEQLAAQRQALAVVERFADSLDEERRALFVLAFVEGLPTAEVAEALDLNPNTTYSRVRAMRAELTALLEAERQNPRGSHV